MTAVEQRSDAQPGSTPTTLAVSLREYIEERQRGERERIDLRFADHVIAHTALKDAHDAQHRSEGAAIELADRIQDERNHRQNEWRATFTDNVRTYITRNEAEAMVARTGTTRDALSARLDLLERARERDTGADEVRRASATRTMQVYALAASAIGILTGVLLHFVK